MAACRVRFWRLAHSMTRLARNADGDDLLFVHAGEARLYCDFGHLAVRAGDYVMLPRGTMWRLEVAAPVDVLLIESTNRVFVERSFPVGRGDLGAASWADCSAPASSTPASSTSWIGRQPTSVIRSASVPPHSAKNR